MGEGNTCFFWLCEIQGYCPHNDPAYLARWARADEEHKKYLAEHPRPDPSLYVDASSDEEDAMVAEESGLPSPPVSPRDTNNNMITNVDDNPTQAHRSPSHHPPTIYSRSTRVQRSGVHKGRRHPAASAHTRSISFLPLFMSLTKKLL